MSMVAYFRDLYVGLVWSVQRDCSGVVPIQVSAVVKDQFIENRAE